ncbi:unnamed protein product [Medioppia subpectinata]|uniref:Uncharacterized protein n=1 Tax=Medioppia subpectinata TaxID=1979941 RepID=A0A7R9L4A6_9ACAR|nr:unnamed protein product [Medioppia subpectinata]CAG2115148.1 unnamed protein product [Medioppia subpectinata]
MALMLPTMNATSAAIMINILVPMNEYLTTCLWALGGLISQSLAYQTNKGTLPTTTCNTLHRGDN